MAGGSGVASGLQETIWAKRAIDESYKEDKVFNGMFGRVGSTTPTTGKPFVVSNEFTGKSGSTAHIGLCIDLNSEGVEGDGNLEGNEESIYTYDFSFSIKQLRNAVKTKGEEDAQKSSIKLYKKFSMLLKDWYRKKRTREICRKLAGLTTYTFSNTPTAATTNRILYGGDATSTATIDSSDKIDPALISKACVFAKNTRATGTDGQPIPPIGKINFGSMEGYALFAHPEVIYDMFRDSEFQQVLREAEVRGKDNPLFMQGDLFYNGVLIRAVDELRDAETSDWGSGSDQPGSTSLFVGSQALVIGEHNQPKLVLEDFDYKNKQGAAIGNIWGLQKSKYNGEDFGVIALKTYRTSL